MNIRKTKCQSSTWTIFVLQQTWNCMSQSVYWEMYTAICLLPSMPVSNSEYCLVRLSQVVWISKGNQGKIQEQENIDYNTVR